MSKHTRSRARKTFTRKLEPAAEQWRTARDAGEFWTWGDCSLHNHLNDLVQDHRQGLSYLTRKRLAKKFGWVLVY